MQAAWGGQSNNNPVSTLVYVSDSRALVFSTSNGGRLTQHPWFLYSEQDLYEGMFQEQYAIIHRLETNKLRNIASLFAHMLSADALPWTALSCISLTEADTTSSSRIFIKYLFQVRSPEAVDILHGPNFRIAVLGRCVFEEQCKIFAGCIMCHVLQRKRLSTSRCTRKKRGNALVWVSRNLACLISAHKATPLTGITFPGPLWLQLCPLISCITTLVRLNSIPHKSNLTHTWCIWKDHRLPELHDTEVFSHVCPCSRLVL